MILQQGRLIGDGELGSPGASFPAKLEDCSGLDAVVVGSIQKIVVGFSIHPYKSSTVHASKTQAFAPCVGVDGEWEEGDRCTERARWPRATVWVHEPGTYSRLLMVS